MYFQVVLYAHDCSCRYYAQWKRATECVNSCNCFAVLSNGKEMTELGLESLLIKTTLNSPVFFCYRGYNHKTGKVLKSHKHYH